MALNPLFARSADRLGPWGLYFVAKLALFALGLIDFHLAANLVFAAVLFAMAAPRARAVRPWIGVPVAIALLYYDSRLPGISRAFSQAGLLASFSASYLLELAGRFVSWKVLAVVAAALAVTFAASRVVRVDVAVVAAMVVLALAMQPAPDTVDANAPPAAAPGAAVAPTAATPEARLAQFFRTEATRSVAFARPADGAPPFDVIFLHVCSLSWDDLEVTGLASHPLFAGFDILLTRFNTVSTYSGPAVIRLLRGNCGQPPHPSLYAPAPAQCLLMPALAQAGLETQLALNHDGHFDGFLDYVRAQGVGATPVSLKGIEAPQRAFDDSRIYDDKAVLARWLQERARSPAPRVALYYNTLSLHDGNRLLTNPSVKSSTTYKARLADLLDDLDRFMGELQANGRRAIVVLIPEHGAAMRGDSAQIAGLREVPTPAITRVPVGIRVIGPEAHRVGEAIRADEETSFLAVSHVIAAMLARPPFGPDGFRAADYTAGMPGTPFVAEGESDVVMSQGKGFIARHEREAWKPLR
jgi:cellulose synthase operon protein YhjU